ncbi:hypothetical protein M6D81_25230 [Paenibacillus sp. J5C_2022]|uniref:hypothetical protein n=1 Tax=Paenibacillus sp. J5C2022 TaxID=2977129 RepID=UPI0021D1B132|nr:hypothetical protein [Paenibacillus sp. J5C2022]MCU6712011.1 hypothetical protein [Paenibacillus sp. J5C2022]
MRLCISKMSLIVLVLFVMAGCSEQAPAGIDPMDVEASLDTNPDIVMAGEQVELMTSFTGAEFAETAEVQFDIRVDGKVKLVDAAYTGNGQFTGSFTFPKKGIYNVYIHLYEDELHVTKKKLLEVKER